MESKSPFGASPLGCIPATPPRAATRLLPITKIIICNKKSINKVFFAIIKPRSCPFGGHPWELPRLIACLGKPGERRRLGADPPCTSNHFPCICTTT